MKQLYDGQSSQDVPMQYFCVQPNRWTFQSPKVRNWVEGWLSGEVMNACCGKTKLTHPDGERIVRNDIDEEIDADYHFDAADVAEHFERDSFDTIIFDPPFSMNQAQTTYQGKTVGYDSHTKRQFHEVLRPGGRVIQLGFSTTCMPASLGYKRREVAVFNTLGRMNDWLGTVDERLHPDIRSYGGMA